MSLFKGRNSRNYRSTNNLIKSKIDDSFNSKSSLDSSNLRQEDILLKCGKKMKTTFKPYIPQQEEHNDLNVASNTINKRKRLTAGGTTVSNKLKRIEDNNPKVNIIILNLKESHEKPNVLCREHQLRKSKPCQTCGTQTLYRESSAQTLPYLPGVSNDIRELEDMEIFKLPTILPGDKPPGLYEVEVLERARKRWAFFKSVKENMQHMQKTARAEAEYIKHKHILKAFEWEHWIEREEYIQECQLLRLEILIRMFNNRERHFRATSKQRLEMSCQRIEMERQASLKKNAAKFARNSRLLNRRREKQSRVWRRETIINKLGYPCSDFYAPKMRYGVNPNRRHAEISCKDFDIRMDDLEKQVFNTDSQKLKCPFAKLRAWSKPKQVVQEFEQNFCSEVNLNKLYESLKNLRLESKRTRLQPHCLKSKRNFNYLKSSTEEEEMQDLETYASSEENAAEADLQQKKNSSRDTEKMVSLLESSTSDVKVTLQDMHEEARRRAFAEELRQEKLKERLENEKYRKEMRREQIENMYTSCEGEALGWIMPFLSDELARLNEQRKLHFFCMLALRERWHREAVEAGLRQKENSLRETYEKLYEECDTTNKEITEKYLRNIMDTDIEDYAHQEAENRVVALARTVDKDIEAWLETFNEDQTPLNRTSLRCNLKSIVMADKTEILRRLERDETISYIINDVLFENVFNMLESYDVSTTITNDIIDRLVDNDLYLFSTECSSAESDYVPESSAEAQHEAKAILRKLIRRSVPGRRWRTPIECLADANVNQFLDEVFDIEATKDFIYESTVQAPDLSLKPSLINLIQPDLHERPFYSEDSSETTSIKDLNKHSLDVSSDREFEKYDDILDNTYGEDVLGDEEETHIIKPKESKENAELKSKQELEAHGNESAEEKLNLQENNENIHKIIEKESPRELKEDAEVKHKQQSEAFDNNNISKIVEQEPNLQETNKDSHEIIREESPREPKEDVEVKHKQKSEALENNNTSKIVEEESNLKDNNEEPKEDVDVKDNQQSEILENNNTSKIVEGEPNIQETNEDSHKIIKEESPGELREDVDAKDIQHSETFENNNISKIVEGKPNLQETNEDSHEIIKDESHREPKENVDAQHKQQSEVLENNNISMIVEENLNINHNNEDPQNLIKKESSKELNEEVDVKDKDQSEAHHNENTSSVVDEQSNLKQNNQDTQKAIKEESPRDPKEDIEVKGTRKSETLTVESISTIQKEDSNLRENNANTQDLTKGEPQPERALPEDSELVIIQESKLTIRKASDIIVKELPQEGQTPLRKNQSEIIEKANVNENDKNNMPVNDEDDSQQVRTIQKESDSVFTEEPKLNINERNEGSIIREPGDSI